MPVKKVKLKRRGMSYQGDVKITKDKVKRMRVEKDEEPKAKKTKEKRVKGSSLVHYKHPTKKDTYVISTERKRRKGIKEAEKKKRREKKYEKVRFIRAKF
tara:strand:- start:847 stop:1146 length:300 start_codon:yes stop_codon:yes gene_type:complete